MPSTLPLKPIGVSCFFPAKRFISNDIITVSAKRSEQRMTICIGAICDNRKTAIACADRMLTSSDNTLAFEHDVPKISELFLKVRSFNCWCCNNTSADITSSSNRNQGNKAQCFASCEQIKNNYQDCRRAYMSDLLFARRGLNLADFYRNQKTYTKAQLSN